MFSINTSSFANNPTTPILGVFKRDAICISTNGIAPGLGTFATVPQYISLIETDDTGREVDEVPVGVEGVLVEPVVYDKVDMKLVL